MTLMYFKQSRQLVQSRRFRIGLLLVAALLIGVQWRFYTAQTQAKHLVQERARFAASEAKIPPTGRNSNDTGGKIPGNPQNAVTDLKRIHRLSAIYRDKHNGAFPPSAMDLMREVRQHPQDYGLSGNRAFEDVFFNPDTQYADRVPTRQNAHRHCPYAISDRRPDGSKIGSAKPAGTRDIVAFTDLYYHQNVRVFRGERSTENPVGFFLVLWEDGKIERVPYDKQIYARMPDGNYTFGFPGQAGIAPGSLTYDQFYQKLGWKKGPRGREGGPGLSYNMTIVKRKQ